MTEEQIKKISFHFSGHMSMADEHTSTYVSDDGRFAFCDHTKVKEDFEGMQEFGRTYRHYMYDGRVYKSWKKFVEALKDVEL